MVASILWQCSWISALFAAGAIFVMVGLFDKGLRARGKAVIFAFRIALQYLILMGLASLIAHSYLATRPPVAMVLSSAFIFLELYLVLIVLGDLRRDNATFDKENRTL